MKRSKKYTIIALASVLFILLEAYIIQVAYHYQSAYQHGICTDETSQDTSIKARNLYTLQTKDFRTYCRMPKGWYVIDDYMYQKDI